MPGFVYLVGAGPGDPELLTIKAAKAIAKADVILIDDLVDERTLEHAKHDARVQWVGKRGGCQSTPQAFIERLMVHEAKAGHCVVRLKGGDPSIFGRLGEELAALKAADIQFEIINGISSGLAAASACGLSLTHRDHSQGVVFVTGHAKPNGNEANIAQLVKTGFTVVIYMGISRAQHIQTDLLAASCDADLPIALVQGAATAQQKIVPATIATLCQVIDAENIQSPALIVIGRVTESMQLQQNPIELEFARQAP